MYLSCSFVTMFLFEINSECLSSGIGGLLADLAEVDRGTDLLWNLLARLLGHLLTFLPGYTHTPLLRNLNEYKYN